MEITRTDRSSFVIKGERTVTINGTNGQTSDITLFSQRQPGTQLITNGPGEYEIGEVLIVTHEIGRRSDRTLAHSVLIGDLNVVHLGEGSHELTDRDVDVLAPVDVLLIDAVNIPMARSAITALTPRVVIPFGEGAAELCRALGVDGTEEAKFTWNGSTKAPKALMLKIANTRKRAA